MDTSIPTGERSEQSAGSAANETNNPYRSLSASSTSSSSSSRPTAPTRTVVRASAKSGESSTRIKLVHQGYFNRFPDDFDLNDLE
ncbi:hypothetical protein MHU86_1500 [Fragilaria crotonensis]|nr:hypothetical protein MHU86_1500 [Fragilaria crotonensis]